MGYGTPISTILLAFCLPFAASELLPRQLLGIPGLNPVNVILIISLIAGVRQKNATSDQSSGQSRILLWLIVGPFLIQGVHGILNIKNIPVHYLVDNYFRNPDALLPDPSTPSGYITSVILKPLVMILAAIALSFAARNPVGAIALIRVSQLSLVFISVTILLTVASTGASLSELSGAESRGLLSWTGLHANEIGLLLSMGFTQSLFLIRGTEPGSIERRTSMLATIFAAAAVVITFSRGAYIGAFLGMLFFIGARGLVSLVIATPLTLVVLYIALPTAALDRLLTGVSQGDVGEVSAGRLEDIWIPLMPDMLGSLVFGGGLGSIMWSDAMRSAAILPVGHPHSAYISLILDFGVPLGIPILLFWVLIYKGFRLLSEVDSNRYLSNYLRSSAICVFILAVQGITDDKFTPTPAQAFLWTAVGIILGLSGRSTSAREVR